MINKGQYNSSIVKRIGIWFQGYLVYAGASLRNRLFVLALLTVIAVLLGVAAVWQIDHRMHRVRQAKRASHLNDNLEQILITRFGNTSALLARSDAVIRLLKGELSDADLQVSLTLDTTRTITGADFVYLLDAGGVCIAASEHWSKRQTMGKRHDFRPYFQRAMTGNSALYTAVGSTTRERGVYFAYPVKDPVSSKPIGVAVVKVGMEELDKLFLAQEDRVLLVSPDGVIFATNHPAWLYRTTSRLSDETKVRLSRERQFPDASLLRPIPVDITDAYKRVRIGASFYDMHKQPAAIPGWQLVTMSRHAFPVSGTIATSIIGLCVALVFLLYLVSQDKKRRLQSSYDMQSLDLTRTRNDLLKSEAMLQSVVEDQAELICRFDIQWRIRFANSAYCRYFGRQRDVLIGSQFDMHCVGEDRDAVMECLDQLSQDAPVGSVEYRAELPGGGLRWHAATIRKIFDESGNPSEYQFVLRDITERQQSAEALKDANAELSQYAYVISHDLRAPLRAIHNYADFLREDLQDTLEGDQRLYLDRLDKAIHEAEMLIDDVLVLSRVSHCNISPASTDSGHLLDQLVSALELPGDVRVVRHGSDWPVVEAEPVLLRQIFQNLILNGAKYNNSTEKLVELSCAPDGKGRYVFSVRDNGIGIDKRYHEQIFRVFERLHTRQEYEGTGAGLAIVKKAVQRLHGTVSLESEPGNGSTFHVILPEKQGETEP
ncbi:MAG TPA: ATP-binding protein [Deltaproteobacteria bacterium]|nr:ATP-binding protein [Deltaproteobacteria bacterium]